MCLRVINAPRAQRWLESRRVARTHARAGNRTVSNSAITSCELRVYNSIGMDYAVGRRAPCNLFAYYYNFVLHLSEKSGAYFDCVFIYLHSALQAATLCGCDSNFLSFLCYLRAEKHLFPPLPCAFKTDRRVASRCSSPNARLRAVSFAVTLRNNDDVNSNVVINKMSASETCFLSLKLL